VAAGATAVTIMDDARTPLSAWLAISLAFPSGTRLCQHLRQSNPEPAKLGGLIQRYLDGSDDNLSAALNGQQGDYDLSALRSDSTARKIEQALAWQAASTEHYLLGLDHPAYPTLLQDTADSPPLLYAKGSLAALNHPMLAIVGSRKASHQALAHARTLAAQLAGRGIGIVSGLALGIDAAAHEGALEAGGVTIAVAATEPDSVYPKRHQSLAQRIVESGGLILTEYPIGTPTLRWFFPQRNRIISGISLGVLVAEASLPSGTLTTARHAMDQGREVMAVPGSIHNLQARGCHALIKQGAALIETEEDVIDTLGQPLQRQLVNMYTACKPQTNEDVILQRQNEMAIQSSIKQTLSDTEKDLLDCLSNQPATLDDLMTHTSLNVSQLSSVLGILEINGIIRTTTGGRYARC
jgi:DNA processing protein